MSATVRAKQIRTGAWTVLAVLAVVLAVALLSAIDDANGNPWIDNNIVVQLLLTVSAVAAIALPSLISARRDVAETRETTQAVRDQVQNSHTINFRDDTDQKHDTVVDLLAELSRNFDAKMEGVHSDLRGMRRDIGRNTDQIDRHGSRIQDLGDKFQLHKDNVASEFETVERVLSEIKTATGSIPIVRPCPDPPKE